MRLAPGSDVPARQLTPVIGPPVPVPDPGRPGPGPGPEGGAMTAYQPGAAS